MKEQKKGKKPSQDQSELDQVIKNVEEKINKIQTKRNSKLLVFLCHKSIDSGVAFELNRLLRKMGNVENLDIFLESGGGNLDSAYKVLKLFRAYSKKTTSMVPFYAKSAASLIALGTDDLILCKAGELGPLDPQVMDPQTHLFVPAHSIKETMDFIDEVKDPIVKLSLTDKIPALLVGSYRASGKASKQYLEEILQRKKIDDKDTVIETFTEKFLSHGYPMDKEFLKQNHIHVNDSQPDLEDDISDLHEIYIEFCNKMYDKEPDEEVMIIQTDKHHICIFGDKKISENLD